MRIRITDTPPDTDGNRPPSDRCHTPTVRALEAAHRPGRGASATRQRPSDSEPRPHWCRPRLRREDPPRRKGAAKAAQVFDEQLEREQPRGEPRRRSSGTPGPVEKSDVDGSRGQVAHGEVQVSVAVEVAHAHQLYRGLLLSFEGREARIDNAPETITGHSTLFERRVNQLDDLLVGKRRRQIHDFVRIKVTRDDKPRPAG